MTVRSEYAAWAAHAHSGIVGNHARLTDANDRPATYATRTGSQPRRMGPTHGPQQDATLGTET